MQFFATKANYLCLSQVLIDECDYFIVFTSKSISNERPVQNSAHDID